MHVQAERSRHQFVKNVLQPATALLVLIGGGCVVEVKTRAGSQTKVPVVFRACTTQHMSVHIQQHASNSQDEPRTACFG